MNKNEIIYDNDAWIPQTIEKFFCSTATALVQGQGVCLNSDYGTATAVDGRRLQVVEAPSVTNNRDFVGVLVSAKAAHTSGELMVVEVVTKGGALVNVGASSVTLGDYLTCDVLDGKFYAAGEQGRGTVKVLQTLSAAGLALALLQEGAQSGLVHTQAIAAGGGAVVLTPTGRSLVDGTLADTADSTFTLANGKVIGERKSVKMAVAMAANDLVVTVTSGVQIDRTTALASVTLNAQNEEFHVEWNGKTWALLDYSGATLA